MNLEKIGRLIAECRKAQGLTQLQLAEKLHITDRAVSKWETGRALPDSSIMLELCGLLKITVNDLLSGEVVSMENYHKETEKLLMEMVKQKEEADQRLLSLEILIGTLSVVFLVGFTAIAAYLPMADWQRILLIVIGVVGGLIGIFYALRIEQVAGYYQCAKCGHRYVPGYQSVLWAMHMGRTRYMKCPECQKFSWQKKVLSKE